MMHIDYADDARESLACKKREDGDCLSANDNMCIIAKALAARYRVAEAGGRKWAAAK